MIDSDLLAALQGCKNVLCVSHVNPDGDAVGSLLGMGWILRTLGKQPTLALQDSVPKSVKSVLEVQDIVGEQAIGVDYDLIVCLDASSPDRMGRIYQKEAHRHIPLIVIDHHITNTYFGTYNWVAPDCAATCQMLVYLAEELDIPLAGNLAECLLTGLVTDTHGFRTSNTDARVLEAAMKLVQGGADLATITEQTLNRRPFSVLKLWGMVLSDVSLEDGVIWTTVSQTQLQEVENPAADSSLSSTLITAAEADMSASFKEKRGPDGLPAVECSFRAKPGFDVSQVAFSFGGGGHPPASGCTIQGTLAEVTPNVVMALKQARREQVQTA